MKIKQASNYLLNWRGAGGGVGVCADKRNSLGQIKAKMIFWCRILKKPATEEGQTNYLCTYFYNKSTKDSA